MLARLIYFFWGVLGLIGIFLMLDFISEFSFKRLFILFSLWVVFFIMSFYLPLYFTI